MELKRVRKTFELRRSGFESHLYGIETNPLMHIVSNYVCLNRTFMELKHDKNVHC